MPSIPASIIEAPHAAPDDAPALAVERLSVDFAARGGGSLTVVREVSFALRQRETLALVGESGSGKSVTSLAMMRLTPPAPRSLVSGRVLLRRKSGAVEDLLQLAEDDIRDVRGNEISMIFQEPMTSLNPVHRIGDQIAEAIGFHQAADRRTALRRAVELLELVGIPEPQRRVANYPHHLSGGMRQRVMIAMALACNPKVL